MKNSCEVRRRVGTLVGGLRAVFGAGLLLVAGSQSVHAQISVTTSGNDIGRTGQNLNETILTTSNVNTTEFGKLFSQPVDGFVYAQPLYLPDVTIGGKAHNVVFVATEHDSVYAFDADNNGGSNASPLWFASMLAAAHGAAAGATTVSSDILSTDISPEVGITGTPVIDPTTGTLYVVSKTQEGATFVQRLHALDITSGAEKFGGPVVILPSVAGTGSGSSGGTITFDSEWENQRPGLLLLHGIVYVGFAAHGDNGPWHGWILGYNAQTLKQTGAFCASPKGVGSGVWMTGVGLAAEVIDPVNHPFGRMFIPTGNGDYTATVPYAPGMDYGNSILNLDLTNGIPTVQDEFTPSNQATLDEADSDLGAGGLLILPNQTTGNYPHLLVQAGKSGEILLLNRDNLGGYHTAGDQAVQEVPTSAGISPSWNTPTYWNGTVYYWAERDHLKAFSVVNGQLTGPTAVSSEGYNFPGANPSISSNGNTQGIVWSVETDAYSTAGPAVLQAHNASNVSISLYSSNTNSSRDSAGPAVKYVVPTVVNGKVYVGAQYQVDVFGLLNGQQTAAAPVMSPGAENFTGTLAVDISDSTSGAVIYYTLDGSTPSSTSAIYSSPIAISATTTIQAVASAPGYLQSLASSATYTSVSHAVAPSFSPGGTTLTQPTSVTISDATAGATIYYTTNGSTPTASSTQYTKPIVISASETLNAIAVAPGLAASTVATATYTLASGQTGIDFPVGFAGTQGIMILNGSTDLDDSRLQLTDGAVNEAGSAWFYEPVNVQAFTTNFSFQLSNPVADGMTFTIQGQNLNALGKSGGGLGYQGIPTSVAIKFDLHSNAGEGSDSTGLYTDGASPTVPAIDLSTTGINLHSDDTMQISLVYNGTVLSMTITDMVTGAVYSTSWPVNIPAIIGGNNAYVGFTGGTGGGSSSQKILTWNYSVGAASLPVSTTPTFSPAAGNYTSTQTVSISSSTAGAAIYYTTNGTTPTASSAAYSGPVTVNSTETLEAIAIEAGYTNSPVASAAYTITTILPSLPSPTFSPAAATYSSAQTVAIKNATAGTTIYYTTNGSTPTTSSTTYSGPITVSATETLEAIAVETGYTNSSAATAAYTINLGSTTYINYSSGQFNATSLSLNGGSTVTSGGALQLTDGKGGESRSAWFTTEVPIQTFTTDFTFQQLNANADGMTFTIQREGTAADGASGGGLGYQGIPTSVAVKFDLHSNAGEGIDSTGLYTDGAPPTMPAVNLSTTGINLHSGDVMHAHIVYDGTNLTMTLTDTVTNASVIEVFPVNIPATLGGNTAWVGFTGGTGGTTATQNILSWAYVSE